MYWQTCSQSSPSWDLLVDRRVKMLWSTWHILCKFSSSAKLSGRIVKTEPITETHHQNAILSSNMCGCYIIGRVCANIAVRQYSAPSHLVSFPPLVASLFHPPPPPPLMMQLLGSCMTTTRKRRTRGPSRVNESPGCGWLWRMLLPLVAHERNGKLCENCANKSGMRDAERRKKAPSVMQSQLRTTRRW